MFVNILLLYFWIYIKISIWLEDKNVC